MDLHEELIKINVFLPHRIKKTIKCAEYCKIIRNFAAQNNKYE